MDGDGTDRIVDLDLVHGHDAAHHDRTTDGTDDHCQQGRGIGRLRGNGHQAGESAVQGHGQVRLAEHEA